MLQKWLILKEIKKRIDEVKRKIWTFGGKAGKKRRSNEAQLANVSHKVEEEKELEAKVE